MLARRPTVSDLFRRPERENRPLYTVSSVGDVILGFHPQQAVEKALKVWPSFLGLAYPRIHHLKNLFDLLEERDPAGVLPFRALERLTPFAVQFRYDDLDPADVTDDFREAIDQVGDLLGHVDRLVNSTP